MLLMPQCSYSLLDKEDTGFVYVLLSANVSSAKLPVLNACRYTSADEMSVVVASRQCLQVCRMRGRRRSIGVGISLVSTT